MTLLHQFTLGRTRRRAAMLTACALVLLLGITSTVDARITRIQITNKESPTFGGASFGDVGTYE